MNNRLSYQKAGVNYDLMDPFKRLAQIEGKKTRNNLRNTAYKEVSASRGESAFVLETSTHYLVLVEEGLGTKSLVADQMESISGKTYYDALAQDTVAMMVNDLITVGAKPVTIVAYWAVGSSKWFENKERTSDLIYGWRKACDLSAAVWGGGETPTLSGIIEKNAIDLAGACFGIIKPKSRLTLGQNLRAGDSIILFESSGIHANGLTLARKIASRLPHGYETRISDGRTYGEALLEPTIIYARLIEDLFKNNIDIHYMANITGHGWRKLMRHPNALTYKITSLPPVPPVLLFMCNKGPIDQKEAYGNLNMGAGFAVFMPEKDTQLALRISKKHHITGLVAGRVEKGKKRVIIEPNRIVFEGASLSVRAS